MLCTLNNIDGQALVCAGVFLNTINLACSHLIKGKNNWLHFLMGAAAALAIFFIVLGLVKLKN